MKEIVFQNRNISKWEAFEKQIDGNDYMSLDSVSNLYTELNDDLSYARTYYPNSETELYLNNLLLKVHYLVHKKKEREKKSFGHFWIHVLPSVLKDNSWQTFYAFLLFAVGIAIGVLSANNDVSFARMILGDGYVNMTIDNIKNGRPFDVYAQSGEFEMFFRIMLNNVRVSFFAFAFGIAFGIGSGYLLISNGVMVGVFHAFLAQYGLLEETFLTLWLHGTIELSVIVFAGGAGLAMGKALIHPKTYSRAQTLKIHAMNGAKIIVGLIPFFILAAFIEGYVTRHYLTMSLGVKLAFIVPSAILIVGYLIVYPQVHYKLFRSHANRVGKAA